MSRARERIESHRRMVIAMALGIGLFWVAVAALAGLGAWWAWHEWGRLLLALREALS